jgi:hypothetical protein
LWNFGRGGLGQYEFVESTSVNFELHESEQTEIVLKILLYSGIIIRDPEVVQTAAALVQAEETNKKS